MKSHVCLPNLVFFMSVSDEKLCQINFRTEHHGAVEMTKSPQSLRGGSLRYELVRKKVGFVYIKKHIIFLS